MTGTLISRLEDLLTTAIDDQPSRGRKQTRVLPIEHEDFVFAVRVKPGTKTRPHKVSWTVLDEGTEAADAFEDEPADTEDQLEGSNLTGLAHAIGLKILEQVHEMTENEETALVPEVVLDDDIDTLVQEINVLHASAPLQLALEIGKLIVTRFYGGDLEAVRARDPLKDTSFRKLAEHPDLQVSKSALHRSVGVYELCTRLGASARGHLTLSHLRALLPLPEKKQKQLLDKALRHGWTTRQLEAKAANAKKKTGAGRPPLPGFVKAIRGLARLVDDRETFADLDDEHIEDLEEDEALKLYQAVTGMKLKCEELQKKLSEKAGMGSRPD